MIDQPEQHRPYAPTGFCVRCLYPGTPGETCSECGGRMVSRESKEGRLRTGAMSWRKWLWVWLATSAAHVVLSHLAIEAAFAGFLSSWRRSSWQRLANVLGGCMLRILHPWVMLPVEIPDSMNPLDDYGLWIILVAWAAIYSAGLLLLLGRIRAWRIKRRIQQIGGGIAR